MSSADGAVYAAAHCNSVCHLFGVRYAKVDDPMLHQAPMVPPGVPRLQGPQDGPPGPHVPPMHLGNGPPGPPGGPIGMPPSEGAPFLPMPPPFGAPPPGMMGGMPAPANLMGPGPPQMPPPMGFPDMPNGGMYDGNGMGPPLKRQRIEEDVTDLLQRKTVRDR